MSVDEMSVDEMSVDEVSVDKVTCCQNSYNFNLHFAKFKFKIKTSRTM